MNDNVADHIAEAEEALAETHPHTATDHALLAIAHAVVAYVRHETGYPGTPSEAN